jgi:hypothetical protein
MSRAVGSICETEIAWDVPGISIGRWARERPGQEVSSASSELTLTRTSCMDGFRERLVMSVAFLLASEDALVAVGLRVEVSLHRQAADRVRQTA